MSIQLPEYLEITDNPSEVLQETIAQLKPDKIGILVDENTIVNCLPKFDLEAATIIEIKSGELNKTLNTCTDIWSRLTDASFTRKSLLINLGGGVIGDMGGFCASTFKRGINFINIPTTLLSQVDASIGGKLGVDFNGLKNHIGLFALPQKVIVSPNFLGTLPRREIRSGFAEIIKHALIADGEMWMQLKNLRLDEMDWNEIIPKSIAVKNSIVTKDPLENGLRKILNYGHTIGHAIETSRLSTENPLLHGEAIAQGMLVENEISLQLGLLSVSEVNEIANYLNTIFNDVEKTAIPEEQIEKLLLQDKKNQSANISLSLIDAIGSCKYDQLITLADLKKML